MQLLERTSRAWGLRRGALGAVMTGALACAAPAHALPGATAAADLTELTLEQLSNIVVTSASRRAEPLAAAAASIYVITADDIRGSSATTLPEVLRLAPNLDVARADANQYAISARGFNNVIANNMLVLIDGRTVYTPLFSGVFWEAQNVMLEDIERIEVISGPGATLWGANAVNGVINIITRPARDTQGGLASAGAGKLERGGAARYGGELGGGGFYRIYAKYWNRDHTELNNHTPILDAETGRQAGFRADWGGAERGYTVQGDVYSGSAEMAPQSRDFSGGNLLARYNRQFDNGNALRMQAYFDRTERFHKTLFHETLDTADFELQHNLSALGAHNLVWGGGYRFSRDHTDASLADRFDPADLDMKWANIFLQDEIALRPDLQLSLGAKSETNIYTGAEFLPSARLAWRPAEARLVWAALSRAVRAPSRLDRDFYTPNAPPYLITASPDFQSEVSNVAELGYRAQPYSTLTFSATAFHHMHDRLRSVTPTPGGAMFGNNIEGTTSGVESWATLQAARNWRISGGLVWMRERLHVKPGAIDAGGLGALGNDPSHWWSLRSAWDISSALRFDASVRHTGARGAPNVPAYTELDARLAWRVSHSVELALVAQNLADPKHPEWGTLGNRALFSRSTFLLATWRQ